MEYTGSNLNGKQFSSTVQFLSQQKSSRWGNKVRLESVTNAEEAYFNVIAAEPDPTQDTDRHGDTPYDEYDANRRKVVPVPFEKGTRIAKKDVARMTVNPQNPVVMSHAMAFGRKKDKVIYAAALGTAYKGKEGTTAVTFAADSIGIDGDGDVSTLGTAAANSSITEVPMTLSKMLTMMTIFNEADVDPDMMKYWAVSPNDVKHMLSMVEIGSADYNTVRALQAGKIEEYMGFNFFWWNFLNRDSDDGTCNRTLAWAHDGLILATIGEFNTKVDILPTKKYDTGVYSTCDIGAVRMEGEKVHECLNLVTQTITAKKDQ
jgi:hypothetical protein